MSVIGLYSQLWPWAVALGIVGLAYVGYLVWRRRDQRVRIDRDVDMEEVQRRLDARQHASDDSMKQWEEKLAVQVKLEAAAVDPVDFHNKQPKP